MIRRMTPEQIATLSKPRASGDDPLIALSKVMSPE